MAVNDLVAIAQEFSPRFESRRDVVTIDVRGLDRLLGGAQTIGEELRREAARRGVRVHVAVAGTRTAALVLAIARPGLTVVTPGGERDALAPLAIGILEKIDAITTINAEHAEHAEKHLYKSKTLRSRRSLRSIVGGSGRSARWRRCRRPISRRGSGGRACVWQALARGDDVRPLVPDAAEERFESSMDLEWPIEGLEPLSFVLTRLLEPLSIRLERRDRGVAVLHVQLGLVGGDLHARRLDLPSPMRDVRALRTLALLDLESHPPAAAVDRVTIVVDPTPGRVVQHTLFARPQLTPEQLSTLLARLGAVMGQDRIGSPATVDSYRPGAFAMKPFASQQSAVASRQSRAAGFGRDCGLRTADCDSTARTAGSSPADCSSPLPPAGAGTRRGGRERTARARDDGSARVCGGNGRARVGTVEDVGGMVEHGGGRARAGRARRAGIATSGTSRSTTAARIACSWTAPRAAGSSTPSVIERVATGPPCTSSFTPRPHSVFSRPRRCLKRSSSAPPISAIPRSRCSIATVSTAPRGFTKPRSRPGCGRSSARS